MNTDMPHIQRLEGMARLRAHQGRVDDHGKLGPIRIGASAEYLDVSLGPKTTF
jgi:hypothetical protein